MDMVESVLIDHLLEKNWAFLKTDDKVKLVALRADRKVKSNV